MKTQFGPQRLLFPMPTVLVVTGNMEQANIVTIAWISMLTGKPPTLGIAVGSKGYSGEQIKKNKNFSVNLAAGEIMRETDFCGLVSGRDTDKFSETGLTKIPSKRIQSPIIKECPVNVECILKETSMTGATFHFVGEIAETHVDEDKIRDVSTPGSIDIAAINPLIYFSGARQYWNLKEQTGNAYSIGREMENE